VEYFAAAVGAVIDKLESAGFEVVDAAFEENFTPHLVGQKDDQLLFVLVHAVEGPHLSSFSEAAFNAEVLPQVESITTHPKARAVADLAQKHHGYAELVVVALLPTDDEHEDGSPIYFAKVFPSRAIDPWGRLGDATGS